jgi:hypothetical protein
VKTEEELQKGVVLPTRSVFDGGTEEDGKV